MPTLFFLKFIEQLICAKFYIQHLTCIISFHFYWDSSRSYPHFTAAKPSFDSLNSSSRVLELGWSRAKIRIQVCFNSKLLRHLAVSSVICLLQANFTGSFSGVPQYLVHKDSTGLLYTFRCKRFWLHCYTVPFRAGTVSVPLCVLCACHLVGAQPTSVCWADLWNDRHLLCYFIFLKFHKIRYLKWSDLINIPPISVIEI